MTGPWIIDHYTPKAGASFIRNPDYWDKARTALPDRAEFTFYTDEQPQIVPQVATGDFARRGLRRPIAGDTEADVFIGIRLLRVDLGDQPLSSFNLLKLLDAGRKTDLLITKFA